MNLVFNRAVRRCFKITLLVLHKAVFLQECLFRFGFRLLDVVTRSVLLLLSVILFLTVFPIFCPGIKFRLLDAVTRSCISSMTAMVRIPWQIAHRLLIGTILIFRRKGVVLPVFCMRCSSHFLVFGKCLFFKCLCRLLFLSLFCHLHCVLLLHGFLRLGIHNLIGLGVCRVFIHEWNYHIVKQYQTTSRLGVGDIG